MMQDKARMLKFDSRFTKCGRASDCFVPDERKADAVAKICLNCPLPECNKFKCKRFDEELKKLKVKKND